MKTYQPKIDEDAMTYFLHKVKVMFVSALNALELAVLSADNDKDSYRHVTSQDAKDCLRKGAFVSDKDGDMHYDVIERFPKIIRGSDVNAALHYLARLIEAGDYLQ